MDAAFTEHKPNQLVQFRFLNLLLKTMYVYTYLSWPFLSEGIAI